MTCFDVITSGGQKQFHFKARITTPYIKLVFIYYALYLCTTWSFDILKTYVILMLIMLVKKLYKYVTFAKNEI